MLSLFFFLGGGGGVGMGRGVGGTVFNMKYLKYYGMTLTQLGPIYNNNNNNTHTHTHKKKEKKGGIGRGICWG